MRFKKLLPSFLLILVSFSSVPTKVQIDEFINTETVTNESIINGGINFIGSINDSYTTIDSKQVVTLNENVKSLFISKYKIDTDLDIDNLPRYNLAYTILNNGTFQSKLETYERTCYQAFREMKVQLYFIESKTKEKVWGGSINKKLYNQNCSPKTEPSDGSLGEVIFGILIGAVIDTAIDSAIGTYPKAPSVILISNEIFNDFINSLPTMNSKES